MSHLAIVGIEAKLYRATRANVVQDDLSALVVSGKVSHNVDSDTQSWCDLALLDTTVLTPYVDWVRPELTLRYADGSVVTEQVGLFNVAPPTQEHERRVSTGTVDGRDATSLLLRDQFLDGYSVASGTNYVTAVRTVLTGAGFGAAQISIPPTTKTLPAAQSWEPGTTRLRVVNDLLDGIAYYRLSANRQGVLTSGDRLTSLAQASPATTYTSGTGSTLVGKVSDQPDLSRFCNAVVVRKVTPNQATLYARARNDDPASPTGIPTIGLFARPPIDVPTLADQAAADDLAAAYLAEGGTYYRKLTVRTLPDPVFSANDVVGLDITGAGGRVVASGNWRRLTVVVGFSPRDAVTVHTLARVEGYAA